MHLPRYSAFLCLALVLLAGCAYSGGPENPTEYTVWANRVESPPSDATVVPATHAELRDLRPIQRVLANASETNHSHVVVSERVYRDLTADLAGVPRYTEDLANPEDVVVYVEYDGTVFRVSVQARRLA